MDRIKNFFDKRKLRKNFNRINEEGLKEKIYIQGLDFQLCDYILQKTPEFLWMEEMHSLIFYINKKPSGILGRYCGNKKGSIYFGTSVSTFESNQVYLDMHNCEEELDMPQLHNLMYRIFLSNLEDGIKEKIFDEKILKEINNNRRNHLKLVDNC